MSTIDDDEIRARLDAIADGPWTQRSCDARRVIAAPAGAISQNVLAKLQDLSQIPLDRRLQRIQRRLKTVLEPHSATHVPSDRSQEIRDSFDSTLDQLEILELAIETGYLPAESVRQFVRSELVSYLWSAPAREYVDYYQYGGISALAQRAGLSGLRDTRLRRIRPSGAPYFVAFLAAHRAIEEDPATEEWLGFLDDYIIRADEQDEFYDFLESGKRAESRRRFTLVTGAHNFAVMLSDFLETLPRPLRSRLAGHYAYWLAKLFGYDWDRRRSRHVRDVAVWEHNSETCWANAITQWYCIRESKEKDDPTVAFMAQRVRTAHKVLRTCWNDIESVRSEQQPAQRPRRTPS